MKKRVGKKRNEKSSRGFIFNNYLKSFGFLKESRNYFLFSLILFIAIAVIGFIFPVFFVEEVIEMIRKLIEQTAGMNMKELIIFITLNNIKSAFLGMIGGVILGIIPLAVIIVNGYVLGFVSNSAVAAGGAIVLLKLLPHGIFEIPAILFGVGIGLKLGIDLIRNCILLYYRRIGRTKLWIMIVFGIIFFFIAFPIVIILTLIKKELRRRFWRNIKNSLRTFLLVVIPLLIIAGIIEGILIIVMG